MRFFLYVLWSVENPYKENPNMLPREPIAIATSTINLNVPAQMEVAADAALDCPPIDMEECNLPSTESEHLGPIDDIEMRNSENIIRYGLCQIGFLRYFHKTHISLLFSDLILFTSKRSVQEIENNKMKKKIYRKNRLLLTKENCSGKI